MTGLKKIGLLGFLAIGICLLASTAFAGPTWTFGDLDQGQLKLEYKGQFQLLYRDTGAGVNATESATEFNFRRNRLALMGAWEDSFGLYVQTEFTEDRNVQTLGVSDGSTGDFEILDAILRYKFNNGINLWLGKFKYNFTRENLEACEAPLTLDRSGLIRAPFVSTRDKGVAVWGNLFEEKFQYRVDAMNGRNDSTSSPKSNLRYSARAHLSLLDPESGYGYKGTYLGTQKVLTIGAAYQFEQDVAFAGTESVDYKAWTVDLFAEYPVEKVGTFTFSAAYVDYDMGEAYKNGSPDADVTGLNGEKNGGYVKAGFMIANTPLQFFVRGENWSFAKLNNIVSQEVNVTAGGANYYFRDQNLKLTLELAQTDFDQEGTVIGLTTKDFVTAVAQLQVIF